MRKDRGNFFPVPNIILVGKIEDAGRGGFIGLIRFDPAVVDGEFFEIGQDA